MQMVRAAQDPPHSHVTSAADQPTSFSSTLVLRLLILSSTSRMLSFLSMLRNTTSPAWRQGGPDDELISLCRSVKVMPTPPTEPVIDEDERSVMVFVPASASVRVFVFRDVYIGKNDLVVLASVHDYLVRRPHQIRDLFGCHSGLKIDHIFLVLVRANTWFRCTASATY